MVTTGVMEFEKHGTRLSHWTRKGNRPITSSFCRATSTTNATTPVFDLREQFGQTTKFSLPQRILDPVAKPSMPLGILCALMPGEAQIKTADFYRNRSYFRCGEACFRETPGDCRDQVALTYDRNS